MKNLFYLIILLASCQQQPQQPQQVGGQGVVNYTVNGQYYTMSPVWGSGAAVMQKYPGSCGAVNFVINNGSSGSFYLSSHGDTIGLFRNGQATGCGQYVKAWGNYGFTNYQQVLPRDSVYFRVDSITTAGVFGAFRVLGRSITTPTDSISISGTFSGVEYQQIQ